jgi:hypothetical protein
MHRLLGPSTTGPKQRNNNIDNLTTTTTTTTTKTTATDENGTLHFVRTKKENRRCKKRPWVGRCGLTWRGGCLGPGGRGLGGRPRVEAGERRGGSRARTTSRQSQRVLTPRSCGPVGPGQGRTCAHSPTPITESPAQPFSKPTPRH